MKRTEASSRVFEVSPSPPFRNDMFTLQSALAKHLQKMKGRSSLPGGCAKDEEGIAAVCRELAYIQVLLKSTSQTRIEPAPELSPLWWKEFAHPVVLLIHMLHEHPEGQGVFGAASEGHAPVPVTSGLRRTSSF